MTDATPDPQEEPDADKFRHLPPPVKLEDTITTHDPDAPAGQLPGADPETGFLIRHGGA